MKKILFFLAATMMMVACQQKGNNAAEMAADSLQTPEVVDTLVYTAQSKIYEGLIPAASAPGVKYQIALEPDNSYNMVETYVEAEEGKDVTHRYAGKAEAVTVGKEQGLKLALGPDGGYLYVKPVGEDILRVVNEQLEEAASGLNYDLKRK